MNKSVQTIPFNFNSNAVRVINQGGNAWFVAQDVSDLLGYRDASNMARVLDDDVGMIEPISKTADALNPAWRALESAPLRSLWSMIDHMAIMSGGCLRSINKLALH